LDIPNSEFIRLRSSSYDGTRRGGRFCHVVYPLGFALRATTQLDGKAGGLQILCCLGIKVTDYIFTLDA
jgi:hypothetical protein